MSIALKIEDVVYAEKNILATAFHADVQSFSDAEVKLKGALPGSFLTFSLNCQNFCSAVGAEGNIIHKPFRWDASGVWYNGGRTPYETETELLDHLVNYQEPIPFYAN